MIPEDAQLGRGGIPPETAPGYGLAPVPAMFPVLFQGHASLPYQPLGGTAEVQTGRNHVLPGGKVWAGRGAQAPPCLRGQMIPSAHPGLPGGLGEEAWLWSLEPADLTKPPPCLALCLTLTLPRGVNGLWGGVWDCTGETVTNWLQ